MRPQAYGGEVGEVGFLQTHISLLFFVGDRVYKVKKPVDLGFLDFTTLEKRHYFCQEEVRLNRRMAPEIYHGVAGITRGADGRMRVGGSGEVVEWAVEMTRLPEHRMLSRLLETGEIDNGHMNRIVDVLARFHGKCETGPAVDSYGSLDSVRNLVEQNLAQLEPFIHNPDHEPATETDVLTQAQHDFLTARRRAFFDTHRELLARRVAEHRIRDGHGDLHCGNLCLPGDQVVAYDCIEFSPQFRCADVAADLAFLAMDLDHCGYPGFSAYMVKRYSDVTDDPELSSLIGFYKGYRAVVRGKVAALTAADTHLEAADRRNRRREAQRYLSLALGYELPPTLILMCGLPASGKSFVARQLSGPLRAPVYRSDVRRKVARGISPTAGAGDAYGAGLYTREKKRETYESLLESTVSTLESGRSAIVDATFSTRELREPFIETAKRKGVPYLLVHVLTSAEETRARLERRRQVDDEASEAGLEVYLKARSTFQSPNELPHGNVVDVATEVGTPEDQCSLVIERMLSLCAAPEQ